LETKYEGILNKIDQIKPVDYSYNRNFIDGNVSMLSPYISRGVISTKFVLDRLIEKNYDLYRIQKFVQELAWRDYWQQVWIEKKDEINEDLKHPQPNVENYLLSENIANCNTDIEAIDKGIELLYETGYMHNHVRMYVASLCCNIARSHWKNPARWMYYHLLDGDWASNALSWQWVAGSNSNKKYYANQENINKYCKTNQKDTILDYTYEELPDLVVPKKLEKLIELNLKTNLPESKPLLLNNENPTLIYNFYNLDPKWYEDTAANRILLLEPSFFDAYPVSEKVIEFVIELSKNIDGIQIFKGEFKELESRLDINNIRFKEHPLNNHYKGFEEPRDWMFNTKGYYPSFFGFWKRCEREIKNW
jgi:deoxyribodipyrimidine photo-lyase